MSNETFLRHLDEALLVRSWQDDGFTLIQTWHGGTQVNVWQTHETWSEIEEIGVWPLSDDKGRAPSIDDVHTHMKMHYQTLQEERNSG